jgi:hypothetical protein
MSIRPDDLDAEEMQVLKKALSEGRVRTGPSAEYAADLRSRLLGVAVAVQPLRVRSNHRIMFASLFAVGLSAVVLGAVWLFHSEPAWASAIRRARGQACIHTRIVKDNVQKGELWVSPGLDIVSGKLGAATSLLFDYRNKVFLRYDAKQRVLYRARQPENVRLPQELSSVSNLAEVFRRSPSAPSLLPDERIERWSLKGQMVDGTACDEYEIVLRPADRGATTLVLTIDRRSSLPYSFAITESGSHKTTCYFDYPSEGRSDGASLGIPADVEPREVDESGELPDVARTLQEGRDAFDDYSSLAVTSHFDGSRALIQCDPKRVMRKGFKWRIDNVQPHASDFVLPTDSDAALQAWRANENRFHFRPIAICDGNAIGLFEWNGQVSNVRPLQILQLKEESRVDSVGRTLIIPERSCRPIFSLGSMDHVFKVARENEGQQGELIRVDVLLSPKPQNRKTLDATYWLDSGLGDVVRRVEYRRTATADGKDQKSSSPSEVVFQEFNQSPNGFWYPTVIVRDPTDKSKKRTTRLYVDFTDIPSDELFRIHK